MKYGSNIGDIFEDSRFESVTGLVGLMSMLEISNRLPPDGEWLR